jgi:hypothetical protein
MLTATPRRRRVLILSGIALALVALGYLGWSQRWAISGRAVAIVDPQVRRWAAREVARLSDNVYELRASTIVVDKARHRVAIDTITLVTNLAANARRATPLPTVTLRFLGCDLEGIDLEQLAARRGLHMRSAGCDSVRLEGEVPAPKPGSAAAPMRPGVFLSLRDNLDLPREVPFISVDTIAFPQVSIALGLSGRNRRRTVLSLDRFAVRLDSLHYDPKQPVEERGPLLSRDVSLRLVGFEGNREAATRLSLDSMSASLGRGTFQLDGLVYEPIIGSLGDSLGFQALEVGHLQLRGVDWRSFLTAGDVGVSRLTTERVLLRFPPPGAPTKPGTATSTALARPTPTSARPAQRTVGSLLKALGRDMRLDTLDVLGFTLIEGASSRGDSTATILERLMVTGAHFDDSTSWTTAFPVGRITVEADHLTRRQGENQLKVGALRLSVVAGTATVDSLRAGPDGNDAAFRGRHQFRTDRMVLSAARVAIAGMDFPGYLQDGAFRIRRGDATGVELDILTDKRMPSERKRTSHRYPQQALRDLGLAFGADTLTLAGEARYREHAVNAPAPGVVTFRSLRATLHNFSNDPARMQDSTPFHLVADARLMGAGAFHFELEMPLLADQFTMHYRGRLGAMDAMVLNAFASDGAGVKFTRGRIEGIAFEATVTGGRARGRITPRWTNLGIELPGLDRKNTGILGGLKRAVGKFVANAFMVRDDNVAGKKEPPRDGTIDHRWTPRETLPQFLWNSIRDPLVPLLKK